MQHHMGNNTEPIGVHLKFPWFILLHFNTTEARSTTVSDKLHVSRKKVQVYSPTPINQAKSLIVPGALPRDKIFFINCQILSGISNEKVVRLEISMNYTSTMQTFKHAKHFNGVIDT
uniref:Uncharacterized protein n=1 Tax=Opuntia streptacantha TaxID=393608 RepID=A0A7C9DBN9_OPUST